MTLKLDKPFYSPGEVASLAGVHSSTILNYIRAGKLYAVRLSERTYRIPMRSVQKLLEPESVAPPNVIDRPDAVVNDTDADREPKLAEV